MLKPHDEQNITALNKGKIQTSTFTTLPYSPYPNSNVSSNKT